MTGVPRQVAAMAPSAELAEQAPEQDAQFAPAVDPDTSQLRGQDTMFHALPMSRL